ncbi:serum paraoxonase/arylesterase 1-like [Biomphalaria glabrata]|uniref:Paraoxonase n=1 Tax=Biomphalaria glabrata TaxID=6526 RepID=A0A9U8E476_BIOGL|nr:serum paraoxonase/arylesterase 1-like [Biomphalaria glabrata]
MFKQVGIALLAVLLYYGVKIFLFMDYQVHYKKHHPGQCRPVEGQDFGSEDFQVTEEGLAFITSGFNWNVSSSSYKEFLKEKNIKGKILLFDLKNPEQGAVVLKIRPTDQFNVYTFGPHGISVLEDKVKGQHILYVVNHQVSAPDRVEKFRYDPTTKELVHLKYFTSDLFRLTNDLAVVEEDQFYISNYMYFKVPALNILESLLPLPLGSVVFYNGTGFETVIPQLTGPNGITLSKDQRYLYVNFPLLKRVGVWERKEDKRLVPVQMLNLRSAIDNSHLSSSGQGLFLGAHPIVHKVFDHLEEPKNIAPSSVLYVPLMPDGKMAAEDEVIELFYDHGDLITGSTIATVYNNKLLIGSIIHKLVICELNGQVLPDGV